MNRFNKKWVVFAALFLIFSQSFLVFNPISTPDCSKITPKDGILEDLNIKSAEGNPDDIFFDLNQKMDQNGLKTEFNGSLLATYIGIRALNLLGKLSEFNTQYPNYLSNYIMDHFDSLTNRFVEPVNEYSFQEAKLNTIGCQAELSNAFAIMALGELDKLNLLTASIKQDILDYLVQSQRADGSFGGSSKYSRALDTYFIVQAIMILDDSALSETQINLTSTWIKDRQVTKPGAYALGSFQHLFQDPNSVGLMYETAFMLFTAALLGFTGYNQTALDTYLNYAYDPTKGLAYNDEAYPSPYSYLNTYNIVYTTSALFFMLLSRCSIPNSFSVNKYISALISELTTKNRWLTGISEYDSIPVHSLETYWLALEVFTSYNKTGNLTSEMVQQLYSNILGFMKLSADSVSFRLYDSSETMFTDYLNAQLYKINLKLLSEMQKSALYRQIKSYFNNIFNVFFNLRSAPGFYYFRYNSYFVPHEFDGKILDGNIGYTHHPATFYLALKAAGEIGYLDTLISETKIYKYLKQTYAISLVNTNTSAEKPGSFLLLSDNGLFYPKIQEFVSPDFTYYYLKAYELLTKQNGTSITDLFPSNVLDLVESYIRTEFPLSKQDEETRQAKMWESLALINRIKPADINAIKYYVESIFNQPDTKSLRQIGLANGLYAYFKQYISRPSLLTGIRNRVQSLVNSLYQDSYSIKDIESLNQALDVNMFDSTSQVPANVKIGFSFVVSVQFMSIVLNNAYLKEIPVKISINGNTYNMLYQSTVGYSYSQFMFPFTTTTHIPMSIFVEHSGETVIIETKTVYVSSDLIINMKSDTSGDITANWTIVNDMLKGNFEISASIRDYANAKTPFGLLDFGMEAFDNAGNRIKVSLSKSSEETETANITNIQFEIYIKGLQNLSIKLMIMSPFNANATIEKSSGLKFSDNSDALIYEHMINLSEIPANNNNDNSFELSNLDIIAGTGFAATAGISIALLKKKSKAPPVDDNIDFFELSD